MKNKEKGQKKIKMIGLCVTSKDHKIIKTAAAEREMTIKEMIMTAIREYLNNHLHA